MLIKGAQKYVHVKIRRGRNTKGMGGSKAWVGTDVVSPRPGEFARGSNVVDDEVPVRLESQTDTVLVADCRGCRGKRIDLQWVHGRHHRTPCRPSRKLVLERRVERLFDQKAGRGPGCHPTGSRGRRFRRG